MLCAVYSRQSCMKSKRYFASVIEVKQHVPLLRGTRRFREVKNLAKALKDESLRLWDIA